MLKQTSSSGSNKRLKGCENSPGELVADGVVWTAAQLNELDSPDEICGKGEHLVDEPRNLGPRFDHFVGPVDFKIELIAGNDGELAECRRIIGERKSKSSAVAPIDQELKFSPCCRRRNYRLAEFVVLIRDGQLQLRVHRTSTVQPGIAGLQW